MSLSRDSRLDLLTSPAFLAALGLLLLNDAVLKPAFGNALTGKLSDVAGLFAFATFWTALLPRVAGVIHIGTALLLASWKSPLVTPALAAWNALVPVWPLERVIDPTDLLALPVLLASYWLAIRNPTPRPMLTRLTLPVAFIAVFAFAATSRLSTERVPDRYFFAGSFDQFVGQLRALGAEHQGITEPCRGPQKCRVISQLRVKVGQDKIQFEIESFERRRGLIVRVRAVGLGRETRQASGNDASYFFAATVARPLGMPYCLDQLCRRVAPLDPPGARPPSTP